MSWNEPGGQKPRDPWGGGGGGGGNQGPPDLDEVLRNLKKRVNSLFGGSGGGPGGGSGGGGGAAAAAPVIAVILVLIMLVYAFTAFYQVDSAERAVVLRFGKFDRIEGPGLNWHFPPVEEYHKVNVTRVSSHRVSEEMLSKDTNIVSVDLEVQYRVLDPTAYLLRVEDSAEVLRNASESALRHVVGGSFIDEVLSERREEIRTLAGQRLQDYLDRYNTGLMVTAVALDRTEAPAEVRDAFQDVSRAREDEDRFQMQAEAYANRIIPEARGRAERLREEARAYRDQVTERATGEGRRFEQLANQYARAPEVTRQRLYLETMQEVMSRSSKVLVDIAEGSNLLYLPLDKMMERHRADTDEEDKRDRDREKDQGNARSDRSSAERSGSLYGQRIRELRQ